MHSSIIQRQNNSGKQTTHERTAKRGQGGAAPLSAEKERETSTTAVRTPTCTSQQLSHSPARGSLLLSDLSSGTSFHSFKLQGLWRPADLDRPHPEAATPPTYTSSICPPPTTTEHSPLDRLHLFPLSACFHSRLARLVAGLLSVLTFARNPLTPQFVAACSAVKTPT